MKKLKLYKQVFKFKPYDYGFMLEVEREMIYQMMQYFEKSNITDEDKRIAQDLKLAYNLLNIILENTKIVERENGKFGRITSSKLLKYVNIRNANRFKFGLDFRENDDIWNHMVIEELYEHKAWYLYNKLRYQKMFMWWN